VRRLIAKLFFGLGLFIASSAHGGSYEDFFIAVTNDDVRTVTALLRRGFDPNARDPEGNVGLYIAFRDDSPNVAGLLVAHPQINIDAVNPLDETPLMMAALRGELQWSKRLLDLGATINRDGWTPLHYAATGPQPKVVELLIGEGAEVNALGPDGMTPLMMAARFGNEDNADVLLKHGASASARNARGERAADLARSKDREALAKRLERAAR
jgi:ankyrin repeat protein